MEISDSLDLKDSIIVILGLPRLGTSMSMSMLEAGEVSLLEVSIRQAGDDNRK